MRFKEILAQDEGYRSKMYKDTKGIWTIGIGHNIEEHGLSDAVISLIFEEDMESARRDADRSFDWFEDLDEVRQAVILNMVFNMGIPRLKGFRRTMGYISNGEYELASTEMLDSKWAREDVSITRTNRLSKMMLTGRWPE